MGEMVGEPLAMMLRSQPPLFEAARMEMLARLDQAQWTPAPPKKRWAVSDRYRADGLLAELAKLRQDKEILSYVLGHRGTRIPITAVAGNLADAADPGVKKSIARVKRVVRSHSGD